MSWTIAKTSDGASGQQGESDASFSVVYYLRGDPNGSPPDAALDPAQAIAHALVPKLGDSYGDTFPGALCVGIEPLCLGNGWEYSITCRYSTASNGAATSTPGTIGFPSDASVAPDNDNYIGGGFPEGYNPLDPATGLEIIVDADGNAQFISGRGADADPRKLPWQFEQGSRAAIQERYSMYRVSDAGAVTATYESPSILTNGRPLGDAVREEMYLPVFQLSKSVPNSYITPLAAANFEGSVNKTAITIAGISLLPRQAMIMDFRIRRAWFGSKATRYWELSLGIAIFDGTERSDIWILQQDYYEKSGTTIKAIEVAGAPTNRPALLDTNGAKTTTPFYKKFARTNIRDWSSLLLPRRV